MTNTYHLKSLSFLQPFLRLLYDAIQLFLIVLELLSTFQDQTIVISQPLLMHLMEALKIRDVNGLFLRSSSLLYPLQAARRMSFKVDMPMNDGQLVKPIEVFVKFEVKIILHLRHLALLVKQFSEDLFICADASLRKEDSPLRVFALKKMMKMLGTSQYGIILKSIGPSFRFVVVLLKQVEPVDMLPVRHRLRGNHKVRQKSSEEVEKNGLA